MNELIALLYPYRESQSWLCEYANVIVCMSSYKPLFPIPEAIKIVEFIRNLTSNLTTSINLLTKHFLLYILDLEDGYLLNWFA